MISGALRPLLFSALTLTGCMAADGNSADNGPAQAQRCRIPPVIYDSANNPYRSRFVLTEDAFRAAKSESAQGKGSASFAIAQHLLGQREPDVHAATCWFTLSSQQGYEPARPQIVILSLGEAKKNCLRANEYSEKYGIGISSLGEGWLNLLKSCRALAGD